MGGTPDGLFDHAPEPLKENLRGLCDAVRRQGADVGFAQDPDADRLAVVDNHGRYIGEELTLALCADYVLEHTPGPVVVNGSTSRVTADVAARHGSPFYRSRVGEAHVVAKMHEVAAVFGGEGNGGVIEPKIGYVRDSFVGMAYILAGLCARPPKSRRLGRRTPALISSSRTSSRARANGADAACRALEKKYPDASATPRRRPAARLARPLGAGSRQQHRADAPRDCGSPRAIGGSGIMCRSGHRCSRSGRSLRSFPGSSVFLFLRPK